MDTFLDFFLFKLLMNFAVVIWGMIRGWSKWWMVILIVAALIFAIIRSIMKC